MIAAIDLSGGPVSPWVTLPAAAGLMLLVAWHQVALEMSDAPASRKRIRVANGWVILLALPLLATGFSLINPDRTPRAFALVWIAAMGLVCLAVLLAALDMANTWRLSRSSREAVRDALLRLEATRSAAGAPRADPGDNARDARAPDASPGER